MFSLIQHSLFHYTLEHLVILIFLENLYYQNSQFLNTLELYCCSNYQSQRLIASQAVNHLVEYYYRDYKRTQQGVSAELLSYLYKLQIVCATNN